MRLQSIQRQKEAEDRNKDPEYIKQRRPHTATPIRNEPPADDIDDVIMAEPTHFLHQHHPIHTLYIQSHHLIRHHTMILRILYLFLAFLASMYSRTVYSAMRSRYEYHLKRKDAIFLSRQDVFITRSPPTSDEDSPDNNHKHSKLQLLATSAYHLPSPLHE